MYLVRLVQIPWSPKAKAVLLKHSVCVRLDIILIRMMVLAVIFASKTPTRLISLGNRFVMRAQTTPRQSLDLMSRQTACVCLDLELSMPAVKFAPQESRRT